MPRLAVFAGVLLLLLATRLAHLDILWVEEAYPMAAAEQMLRGASLYGGIWFDKPPLFPVFYASWGAQAGWPLRLADALFLFAACAVAWWAACKLWSEREGLWAASLLAFFLCFDTPSAAMALTPDILLIPLQLGALGFMASGSPLAAGLCAGTGMLVNPKAAFVIAACALWGTQWWMRLGLGFAAPLALAAGWMAAAGSLRAFWLQVWEWGAVYSRETMYANPLLEGLKRTANWAGFHAALFVAAFFARKEKWRLWAWAGLALISVCLGLRFFPRYYFLLLPAITLLAARGVVLMPKRAAIAVCMLLIIPLARFGPRYLQLGADLAAHRQPEWRDLALEQDARQAAQILRQRSAPGDNLLVWGYRPEIFVFSQLPAATRYLDSQPLTGVIADRHLTDSRATFPELAKQNREALAAGPMPAWIADGLGPLNPQLRFFEYPEFRAWKDRYDLVAQTKFTRLYRRLPEGYRPVHTAWRF